MSTNIQLAAREDQRRNQRQGPKTQDTNEDDVVYDQELSWNRDELARLLRERDQRRKYVRKLLLWWVGVLIMVVGENRNKSVTDYLPVLVFWTIIVIIGLVDIFAEGYLAARQITRLEKSIDETGPNMLP